MGSAVVKDFVIVGGGASGWMTALMLHKHFNPRHKNINITLIESPDIGVLGVGEATVPNIMRFFRSLGLDEMELLRETDATFKTGILFRNWMAPKGAQPHEYLHPFEQRDVDVTTRWLQSKRYDLERYDETASFVSGLVAGMRAPKLQGAKNYDGVVPYAYHIDAVLLSRYLKKKAISWGVNFIEGTVEKVEVVEGEIASLSLQGGGALTSDLYIDCTGFRGLLIESLAGDEWVSFEDVLPCNKAVAIQVPYSGEEPRPYTQSTALSNGWCWEIDLASRRGTGYVYDGSRLSSSEAEAELCEHLGLKDSNGLPLKHLSMKIGRRERFWVGNCVAIGLAGGFIEPLESTGLHLIQMGIARLVSHIVAKNPNQSLRNRYNKLMSDVYDDLKLFIILHYVLSDRVDTDFWREASSSLAKTPELENLVNLWKHKICDSVDLSEFNTELFTSDNYRFVLYGMNHFPNLLLPFNQRENEMVFKRIRQHRDKLVSMTLRHSDCLASLAK